MKVGKPRKFENVQEMQKAIDTYFSDCDSANKPHTVTGLALALGFNSRQALINYENYSQEYHDTIKRAKLKVEEGYELRMAYGKVNPSGQIFALKNFGWKDENQTDITSKGKSVTYGIADILGKTVPDKVEENPEPTS